MKVPRRKLPSASPWQRRFSVTARRREIRDIKELPESIRPRYQETRNNDLLSLQWPAPPRNILLVKKDCVPAVTASLIEFANHVHSTYPNLSLILEPHVASSIHSSLPFPIYTTPTATSGPNSPTHTTSPSLLHTKVDLITTLGGDGTILHASSLFSTTPRVPPILSFSMGTLGFLSEWKFAEHKRAFREVYMSGAGVGDRSAALGAGEPKPQASDEHADVVPARSDKGGLTGWSSVRGKSMGSQRGAKVLLRNRLKVGVFDAAGEHIKDPTTTFSSSSSSTTTSSGYTYAMNEVHIHRGALPHLTIIQISVGGRFLTEAVADGIIVSTPTGSTAYSLSSGGSIIHPLVSSLLLTPICPRSLSFRPLVLPANTPVVLRLSEKNRGREVEVSVDGVRRGRGVGVGMEVRVVGEEVRRVGGKGGMGDAGGQWEGGEWEGGIPCIMRGTAGADANGDDGWVGGLNGLLKFNYPFGEES